VARVFRAACGWRRWTCFLRLSRFRRESLGSHLREAAKAKASPARELASVLALLENIGVGRLGSVAL